ncbi:STAS/SEC14 domain-containing protein [Rubrivirga litoralis]|uniref:STAS/SEC14 domain-containing protein n=1 Tax=Rubrivirga litoralis TaxID=3075598 RepID=A0ABU3BRM1_9BACT|nr:STAS/SEC14 domain-containing protein [Rubrivirga sp. F394]MDT0631939.1 STAS/SEC14 domain-containing protein [Rubrivirga sp. F394]
MTSALTRLDAPAADGVPVLAYALDGALTSADVDAIQSDLDGHDRVRLLVRVDDVEMPEASTFTRRFVSMKAGALGKVERYAVVGGPAWIARMASTVGALAPFPVRHFEGEDAARGWLSGPATADEIEDRADAAQKAEPAVALLPTHRSDLVALHVDGTLTAADYKSVVDPAVRSALAEHDAVDLLVRIGHLDGLSMGAARQDAALAAHLGRFRKMALVGAPGWLTAVADTVGKLVPVEVDTFEDEAPARAWLGDASA